MKTSRQLYICASFLGLIASGAPTAARAEVNDPSRTIAALQAEIRLLPPSDQAGIHELAGIIDTLEKQRAEQGKPAPTITQPPKAVYNMYAANDLPIHDLNSGVGGRIEQESGTTNGGAPMLPLTNETQPSKTGETPAPPAPAAEINLPAEAASGPRVIAWGGADFTGQSFYTYAGSIQALSAQNIDAQDGFLLRESLGYGKYRFKKAQITGGEVHGNVKVADLMVGYKKAFDRGGIAVYVGGSVEDQSRSANDAGDSVIGTHEGFASSADAQFRPVKNVVLMGMGSYASANESYWSQFSAGYVFPSTPIGSVTIGPTTGFSGGKDYHIQRYGASLSDIDIGFAKMYTYAGYGLQSGSNNSMYCGLGLDRGF